MLRVVGSDGTVSIVKLMPLSPRVENLKVKKVIKVSYLNYGESSVFRVFFGFLCIFTYPYICIVVSWLHYRGRIFGFITLPTLLAQFEM